MVLKLDKYIVTFVFIGTLVAAMMIVMSDVEKNYEVDINGTEDYNEFRTALEQNQNISEDMNSLLTNQSLSKTATISFIARGSVLAFKQFFNSFKMVNTIGTFVAEEFKIPQIFTNAVMIILVFLVLIALLYLFMNFVSSNA